MKTDNIKLSKIVSHALRHEPHLYNLNLDNEGWVEIDILIKCLIKKDPVWSTLSRKDLENMIAFSKKKRHEIKEGKIRALYGHSLETKIVYQEVMPPDFLFHGTSPKSYNMIMKSGLKPMGRQYVHLSEDIETAFKVGLRKSKSPIILKVAAQKAYANGIKFYQGGEKIFLSDRIPINYIKLNDQ